MHLREIKVRPKDPWLGTECTLSGELVAAQCKRSLVWILPGLPFAISDPELQTLWPGICIRQRSLGVPGELLLAHKVIIGGTWTNIYFFTLIAIYSF